MCIFCDIIEGKIPSQMIYQDDIVYAMLDISQAGKGHTLVIPKKHYENIYDCDPEVLAHLIKVVQVLAKKITAKMHADGCNIINNNNETAGQSVMHLHFHIIPRYKNDDFVMKGTPHEYNLQEITNMILDDEN